MLFSLRAVPPTRARARSASDGWTQVHLGVTASPRPGDIGRVNEFWAGRRLSGEPLGSMGCRCAVLGTPLNLIIIPYTQIHRRTRCTVYSNPQRPSGSRVKCNCGGKEKRSALAEWRGCRSAAGIAIFGGLEVAGAGEWGGIVIFVQEAWG